MPNEQLVELHEGANGGGLEPIEPHPSGAPEGDGESLAHDLVRNGL